MKKTLLLWKEIQMMNSQLEITLSRDLFILLESIENFWNVFVMREVS